MMLQIFLLIIGLLGLWGSAELLIKSAQIISHRFKISETFIGLTILSIGTTLPELGTHIASSITILKGNDVSGLAVGTNVGSNIIQITVILGIIALFMTVKSDKKFLKQDYVVMLCSILLLFAFSFGGISRIEGFVLAGAYLIYLWHLGNHEHFNTKMHNHAALKQTWLHMILIPAGIVLLLGFSQLTVNSAEFLAKAWQVRDSLLGVLIIGIGTALPELAAALVAIKRRSKEMGVGVLVGSNITNPLFGMGIGALISTYTVGSDLIWFDIPYWFFASLIAWLFFWRKMKLEKKEAITLIVIYIIYVIIRLMFFASV